MSDRSLVRSHCTASLESLQGRLSDPEIWWRDHSQILESHGYRLRPRYQPDWKPSWKSSNKNPHLFEDYAKSYVRTSSLFSVFIELTITLRAYLLWMLYESKTTHAFSSSAFQQTATRLKLLACSHQRRKSAIPATIAFLFSTISRTRDYPNVAYW